MSKLCIILDRAALSPMQKHRRIILLMLSDTYLTLAVAQTLILYDLLES
jgi:hypothetical protein